MLTLDEFREAYSLIIAKNSSQEQQELELLCYLQRKWHLLPLFSDNHLTLVRSLIGEIDFGLDFNNKRYLPAIPLPYKQMKTFSVSPMRCIGYTWLFENDHSEGKPNAQKLASILLAEGNKLPAIWSERLDKYYVCADGNHRIYAAFLLGHEVRVQCHAVHLLASTDENID